MLLSLFGVGRGGGFKRFHSPRTETKCGTSKFCWRATESCTLCTQVQAHAMCTNVRQQGLLVPCHGRQSHGMTSKFCWRVEQGCTLCTQRTTHAMCTNVCQPDLLAPCRGRQSVCRVKAWPLLLLHAPIRSIFVVMHSHATHLTLWTTDDRYRSAPVTLPGNQPIKLSGACHVASDVQISRTLHNCVPCLFPG